MTNDEFLCPIDGRSLSNAPHHESVSLGIVMVYQDCDNFYALAAGGEIVSVIDVVDVE